jgi:flavin-binding protein dodecin
MWKAWPPPSPEAPDREEIYMGTVARVTEISAMSPTGFEDAIKVGVERASQTLRNITSAWVKEQQVEIRDGAIVGYQVNLMVTFVLDGSQGSKL